MSHAIAIHPIRTARDLRDALARIESLWGAKAGTEILSGKRDLNVRHIRALAARFKVSPAVFV